MIVYETFNMRHLKRRQPIKSKVKKKKPRPVGRPKKRKRVVKVYKKYYKWKIRYDKRLEARAIREERLNRLLVFLEEQDPRVKSLVKMYLGLEGRYRKSYSIRELAIKFMTKEDVIREILRKTLPKLEDELDKVKNL